VIALTAYTEPQPVLNPVSEPQQAYDPAEESPEEFAQILAGMIQKTEQEQTQEATPDDVTDAEINFKTLTEKGKLLFGASDSGGKKVVKKEAAETEFPETDKNYLQSADHLFAESDTDDFLSKISELIIAGNSPEAELDDGFFDVDTKKNVSFSEINSANAKTLTMRDSDKSADKSGEKHAEKTTADFLNASNEKSSEEFLAVEAGKKQERASKENVFSRKENAEAVSAQNRKEELLSAQKEQKTETLGRLDEMRSRSRRDRVSFEVRDLRTAAAANNTQTQSYTAIETTVSRVGGEAPVRELTLELRLPDYNSSSLGQNSAQTSWETKAASAMENMLARELHNSFNGDIVRHASMILRNGGEGTIKLALHPESLGNVKIRLEMAENKITGHIAVESTEALNAFRKELSALEQAFRDSGFADAELNLELTADGSAEDREKEADSYTPQMIASRYEDSFETGGVMQMVDVYIGHKQSSINMLA
jgi:flagellar hook-length control protein FliK